MALQKYFYKDSILEIFIIDTDVVPAGNNIVTFTHSDTVVEVINVSTNKWILEPIEITNLLKENGDAYTDKADLLTGIQNFFFRADIPLTNRVTALENKLLKVYYYAEITTVSGTITPPQGATILLDQWATGEDALVCSIVGGKPSFDPGSTYVSSFNVAGAFVLSGSLPSNPAALIYVFEISRLNFDLYVNNDYIVQFIEILPETLLLDQTTPQSVINGSPIFEGLQFNTTPTTTAEAEGLLRWNPTDRTLDLGLRNGLSTLQIGQEMSLPAYNLTGVEIAEGIPVYITGRHGTLPTIAPAQSNLETTSRIFGVTTTTFAATGDLREGLVTILGYTRKIKTNYTGDGDWGTTWAENDKLYVSKTIAGQFTNVEPTAPHHSDIVAIVSIIGSVGTGSILVFPKIHKTLQELTDVDGTPLTATGQIPTWHQDTQVFDFDYNITNYLPLQAITDTKGLTGFIDPDNITKTYDYTNRTITLSGNLKYYWRGQVKELTSPWTSTGHTNAVGKYYLSSVDGTNFTWSTDQWLFEDIQVSIVFRKSTEAETFALGETHGLMDFEAHEEFHTQWGTYRVSGGVATVGTYTLNSALDASTTPGFDVAAIKDEDLSTSIPAWIQGTYTNMHIGVGVVAVFDIAATFPFKYNASYLQLNDPLTGSLTDGINNRYYNVYQVMIPVTSDAASQKYRTVMLQPQQAFTSLSSAQNEDVRGLNFGDFGTTVPEFVIFGRLTYLTASGDTNTGKCRLMSITYVSGSKAGQVNVTGFTTNDHSILSKLPWLESGHTAGVSEASLAGFNSSGVATRYPAYDAITIACSDITTANTATTNVANFMVPYNCTVLEVISSLDTVCTGAAHITDVNYDGATMLSTKCSIDVSEYSSLTAATPAVISVSTWVKGKKVSIDRDQVGSTIAGAGHQVTFIVIKT